MKNHTYKLVITIAVLFILLLFSLLFPFFSDDTEVYKIVLYTTNALMVIIGAFIVRDHLLTEKSKNNQG